LTWLGLHFPFDAPPPPLWLWREVGQVQILCWYFLINLISIDDGLRVALTQHQNCIMPRKLAAPPGEVPPFWFRFFRACWISKESQPSWHNKWHMARRLLTVAGEKLFISPAIPRNECYIHVIRKLCVLL